MEKLKEALDLVLDTLGLPECDDIYRAREMIRKAVEKDRSVQKEIDLIIKLSINVVYEKRDN